MADNKHGPISIRLNVEPTDLQKSQAWHRIRSTEYKWFAPPYPSLSKQFEDNLEKANEDRILNDARIFAKAQSNSLKNDPVGDFEPPATINEFRDRCELDECCFAGSEFPHADFSRSTLPGVNLQSAVLYESDFQNAVLVGSNFEGAALQGADLRGADLTNATLNGTDLRGAKMKGAILRGTSLINADLRGAEGYEFDYNQSNGLLLLDPKDKWSKLQYTYTNQKLLLNLALFMVFLAPLAVKLLCYNAIGVAQEHAIASETLEFQQTPKGDFSITLENGHLIVKGTETRSVLQLLFEKQLVTMWDAVVVLIAAYNFMRGYITVAIAPLKEEFRRTSRTPSMTQTAGLWKIHAASCWLVWLAYLPAAVLLYQSLVQVVRVPQSLIS